MRTIARFVLLALALGFVGFAGTGCRAQVRGTATVTTPELVLVEGDVWVVERYHEPVFYTEGYYWRFYGGVWYRSTVHTGDWVQVTVVPATVQRIPKPEIYVNYVAPAGATKRTGPPDHAPAHGVRGDEPGHAEGGPPGHEGGPPPGHEHEAGGPPPGHGGGPAMKEDKGPPPGAGPDKGKPAGGPAAGGGPAMKEDKGKPAGGPAAGGGADKGGGAAKEAKPADKGGGPAKEEKPKGGADKGGGDKGGGDKAKDEKKGKK